MIRPSLALVCALIATACLPTRYVVLDNVPPSPSFTVIPASASKDDMAAANLVTEALVSCSVRVIERPVMITEQAQYSEQGSGHALAIGGGGVAGVGGSSAQSGEVAHAVDPTALLEKTTADYAFIVQRQGSGPFVRLIRRSSGQIVYAGPIWEGTAKTESDAVRDAMHGMLVTANVIAK